MKSIIITGGAGDIGLALAHHFASSPTHSPSNQIALLDIDPAAGARAVAAIRSQHPHASVSFVHCDVASWASQAAAFQTVFEAHGGVVDVVVANAGVTEGGGWEEEEEGEAPREPRVGGVMGVNLVGVVYSKFLGGGGGKGVWGCVLTWGSGQVGGVVHEQEAGRGGKQPWVDPVHVVVRGPASAADGTDVLGFQVWGRRAGAGHGGDVGGEGYPD